MRRRIYDVVFALALFALYTTIALVLVAIGARVYMSANETLTANYNDRTSVFYVAQRVRQNDSYDQIRVDRIFGSDALVFSETIDGYTFETWLYVYNGQLCEMLVFAGSEPDPVFSQNIMPLERMAIDTSRQSEGLLTINFTISVGDERQLDLYIRSSALPDDMGGSDERH
ncbi:MAG: DUF4860 domain-containing protein [Coriobacteriia bacterium]|nr:DUF4860 domain-containing protein [Coriobacteriia bacterium]